MMRPGRNRSHIIFSPRKHRHYYYYYTYACVHVSTGRSLRGDQASTCWWLIENRNGIRRSLDGAEYGSPFESISVSF